MICRSEVSTKLEKHMGVSTNFLVKFQTHVKSRHIIFISHYKIYLIISYHENSKHFYDN